MGTAKLERSISYAKLKEGIQMPGVLGIPFNGTYTVEVPNRPGYVYVRIYNNLSEVVQVFNDAVTPVYDLPVIVELNKIDRTKYEIVDRDLAAYKNWGNSITSNLPLHGTEHSVFAPDSYGGRDPVWVHARQFMPLLAYPSGSVDQSPYLQEFSRNVVIYPYTFYDGSAWQYIGGTGTSDILAYNPTTGSRARMVLIYMDENNNPSLDAGELFDSSITGNAYVVPYLPALPSNNVLPVAGVRLESGTTSVNWRNIYDARLFFQHYGTTSTGTASFIQAPYVTIGNDANLTQERALVGGAGISIVDGGANSNVIISVTGSVGGEYLTTDIGARVYHDTDITIPDAVDTVLPFNSERWDTDGIHDTATGTSHKLTCKTAGKYAIIGQAEYEVNATLGRQLYIRLNGTTDIGRVTTPVNDGTTPARMIVSTIYDLDIDDYLELITYQNSGGDLDIKSATQRSPEFTMQLIEAGGCPIPAGIGARVYHDTDVTIPNGTQTTLPFNTERWDTDGIHDTATGSSHKLTCQTAGKYAIIGQAWFDPDANGYRTLGIYLNDTAYISQISDNNPDAVLSTELIVSTIYDLDVGDYITLEVYQNSGGDLDVRYLANGRTPEFMMQLIEVGTTGNPIDIYDDSVIKLYSGTAISFGDNLDVAITGSTAYVDGQAGGSPATYPAIYDNGTFKATGTAISFDDGLDVGVTGGTAYISAPQCGTYQRVGQPIPLLGITGTYWQVPDRVYASGSLAVFLNTVIQVPNVDYEEQFYVSGTFHYLNVPPTGSTHVAMWGVPCATQTQETSPVGNFLLDSDSNILLDSDSNYLLDSDG